MFSSQVFPSYLTVLNYIQIVIWYYCLSRKFQTASFKIGHIVITGNESSKCYLKDCKIIIFRLVDKYRLHYIGIHSVAADNDEIIMVTVDLTDRNED
jgi:hypothetical protein